MRLRNVALSISLCVGLIPLGACGGGGHPAAVTTTVARKPPPRPLPPNAIRIHWHREALLPAIRRGRVCIVTVKTGHFCARYRVHQIPAVELKKKLQAKGFRVLDVPSVHT